MTIIFHIMKFKKNINAERELKKWVAAGPNKTVKINKKS